MANEDDAFFDQLRWIQHDLFDRDVPVLLLIEGCGCRMMGRVTGDVISILEPRGIDYRHFVPDTTSNGRRSLMRCIGEMPANGRFGIFDRGWYSQYLEMLQDGRTDRPEDELSMINSLERFMTDNGTKVVKIYLNTTEDTDSDLGRGQRDCSKLSMGDPHPRKYYDARHDPAASMIRETDRMNAPWDVVHVKDRRRTIYEVTDILMKRLKEPLGTLPFDGTSEEYPNPRKTADLSLKFSGDYDSTVDRLSEELADLQCRLADSERSLVLVFEGLDAAGKGSAIKRITSALNPRGYRAVPVGVPIYEERLHSYMWRFCKNVPDDGMITIFDRSWYGRMLVEAIEGFCTKEEYERSHTEINLFEDVLHRSGTIIIKFWMEVSSKEQLKRFKERENDPMKKWKLTEEDWRNRSKWDLYDKYADKMMERTNTPQAPWVVVESDDKRYSRVKVMQTVVDTLKKELN